MGEPYFYTHAPAFDGYIYNYETETFKLLNYLHDVISEHRRSPFFLLSDDSRWGDRVAHYAFRLYGAAVDRPVSVAWIPLAPHESFIKFANEFWDAVIQLWLRSSGVDPAHEGERVLAFRLFGTGDAKRIYRSIIRSRLAQVFDHDFIVVLDLNLAVSGVNIGRSRAYELAREMLLDQSLSVRVRVVVMAGITAALPPGVDPRGNTVATVRDAALAAGASRADDAPSPDNWSRNGGVPGPDATEVLRPMALVNAAAEKSVVDYFLAKQIWNDRALKHLLYADVFKRMTDGGVTFGRNAARSVAALGAKPAAPADATACNTVNAGKIQLFQPVELFFPQKDGRNVLTAFYKHTDYILDILAGVFGSLASQDLYTVRQLIDRLRNEEDDLETQISAENYLRIRTLIGYLSQFVLIDPAPVGADLFQALERITEGFGRFLTSLPGSGVQQAYDAARLHYNLAYVFDHLPERPRSIVGPERSRTEMLRPTVEYLGRRNHVGETLNVRQRYHLCWYLHDVGRTTESAEGFLELALFFLARGRQLQGPQMDPGENELWALECIFLAFAINPETSLTEAHAQALEHFLARCSGLPDIDAVRAFLAGREGRLLDPVPRCPDSAPVAVAFSRFDLFPALSIANQLCWLYGRNARLVPIETLEPEDVLVVEAENVVLGAPDSPPPIGPYIASLDTTFSRIYQANIMADFVRPLPVHAASYRCAVLVGSGLGAILEAWDEVVRTGFVPCDAEETAMDVFLAWTMLGEVLSTARDAVLVRLVNGLIDRTRQALGKQATQSRTQQELTQAAHNLKAAARTLSDEARVDPETLKQQLRLDELSPPVKSALLHSMDHDSLLNVIDELVDQVRTFDLEAKDVANISEILTVIAENMPERLSLTVKQTDRMNQYAAIFRNYRDQFVHIHEIFEIEQHFDKETFNRTLPRLKGSIRTFKEFVDQVG